MTHPYWSVAFTLAPDRDEDVEVWVQAPTSKQALLTAILQFEIRDGELFHTVHIGRPVQDIAEVESLNQVIAKYSQE